MTGQTVYTTPELLEKVYLSDELSSSQAFLQKIINEYSDVMIDIDEVEFELSKNPVIKSLLKRPHKKTYPLPSYFKNIESERLNEHPRDIFMLNVNDNARDALEAKYGILLLNENNLNKIDIFRNRFRKTTSKGENSKTQDENGKEFSGWTSFTRSFNLYPINSLILIDNYIFSNIKTGKSNLINLVSSILPKTLNVDFQILIVTNNSSGKFTYENISQIKNDLEKRFNEIRNYNIKVCIITHTHKEFHQRLLISNYHLIRSDYGFNLFKDSTTMHSNEMEFLGNYYTLYHNEGEPEIKLVCKNLKAIKELIKKHSSTNPVELLVGDCQNRLLDDF